jgi:hypothetical protein
MDNLEYLQKQLQISEGGGIYFEQGRVDAQKDSAFLFVGLGGTGSDALLRIKNQVRSRMKLPKTDDGFWAADVPKNVAFLELDTDLSTKGKGFGCARFDENSEFLSLSVQDLAGIIKAVQGGGIPNTEWLDPGVSPVAGSAGAGGIRQMGRLMLFWNIAEVRRKVEAAMDKLFVGGQPAPAKIYVFLLTGIAGGTGSGTFLDMAYIIRQIAEERHYQKPQLLGYLALADLYPNGKQSMLKANCFAALKELDYWMSVGEHQDSFR